CPRAPRARSGSTAPGSAASRSRCCGDGSAFAARAWQCRAAAAAGHHMRPGPRGRGAAWPRTRLRLGLAAGLFAQRDPGSCEVPEMIVLLSAFYALAIAIVMIGMGFAAAATTRLQ